jgi:hypothetical protein
MLAVRAEPCKSSFVGMRGIDVFCERCGARQPIERREAPASGATFARRLRSAVTGTTADGVRPPSNSIFLRLCLECRGYSCPNCWNEEAGVCQTCAPLPEAEIIPEFNVPFVYSDAGMYVEPTIVPTTEYEPAAEYEAVFVDAEADGETETAVAEAEAEVEAEPVMAEAEPDPEPVMADAQAELEAEPVVAEAEPEPEPV